MTRINAGIPPSDLTDQHLIAEVCKELIRIPNAIKKKIREGKSIGNIPNKFCLGTGHVRFFYDKLGYLHKRYNLLYFEAERRGFSVTLFDDLFYMEDKEDDSKIMNQYNDWKETKEATILLKERIATRIRESKQVPRYYGKPICKEYYIKNILKYENT